MTTRGRSHRLRRLLPTAALQGVTKSKLGPPMVSWALAIVHTCMYDAWAAYDKHAVGTRLGAAWRRPPAERTLPNTVEAISYAAYRAAVDLLPGSRAGVFDPLMASLGYHPADTTTGTELIDGGSWTPYQPSTFPTPPFPEYASGHSNFTAAGAETCACSPAATGSAPR